MAYYRCGGGESLLHICGKAQLEAGTSGLVQSGQEQTYLVLVGRRQGKWRQEREDQVQQQGGQRYKKGWVVKMSGLHREEPLGRAAYPLGWRVQGRGQVMTATQ